MFALWYLSLAVDQMRKRYGWTFFDIFYATNQASSPKVSEPTTPAMTPAPSSAAASTAPTAAAPVAPAKADEVPTPLPTISQVPATKPSSLPPVTPTTSQPKAPEQKSVPEPKPTAPPVEVKPVTPKAAEQPKAPPPSVPKSSPVPTPPLAEVKPVAPSAPTKAPELPKASPAPVPKSTPTPTPPSRPVEAKPVAPPVAPPAPPKAAEQPPTAPEWVHVTIPTPSPPLAEMKPAASVAPSAPPKVAEPPKAGPASVPTPPPVSVAKPQVTSPPAPHPPATNGSTKDALDKKLYEAVRPSVQNGESLKRDLRDATANFLSGEAMISPPARGAPLLSGRSKDTMVDAAVLTKLEEGYAKLAASNSKSLLKKYLTKEIFDNLKNKKTPTFGSTLLDCIQSGLENHDSGVGIYAPDAEAYSVFADIFDPIIEDYHGGFKKTDKHPAKDFGDVSTFGNLDPNNEFVISTRVRCGRSMQGYPFNPCLTEAQYKEMEEKVSSTLSGLEGELKGKFYPLTGMEKSVQQQLIDDHFLFKEGDRFLQAANACRFWPTGRGIYHNDKKTFLVWCNEEDHLRIISMQMGGDLGEVYRRLTTAVNEIEKRIPFSHDDRLGFLTFCPTNLGTTIRASVHIKVPKLAANKAKLEEVASKYNLQVRGTRGEHTEAEGGIYDISNKRRMGLTEYQAVKEMYDGITELIKLEKSM